MKIFNIDYKNRLDFVKNVKIKMFYETNDFIASTIDSINDILRINDDIYDDLENMYSYYIGFEKSIKIAINNFFDKYSDNILNI